MRFPDDDGEEEPLRLCPAWRRARRVAPLLMVGPAVFFLGLALRSAIGAYAGGFLTLYSARASLVMKRGFTEAWPDGFYNRLGGRRVSVPWEKVKWIIVEPTLFGCYVQVEKGDGERLTLAAPRSGLVADGRTFEADLDRLRAKPGGGRDVLPLHQASRIPAVIVQLTLLTGIVGAVLIAIVR